MFEHAAARGYAALEMAHGKPIVQPQRSTVETEESDDAPDCMRYHRQLRAVLFCLEPRRALMDAAVLHLWRRVLPAPAMAALCWRHFAGMGAIP